MIAEEVKYKIEQEINGNWDISNHHGVDLRSCLIYPIIQEYSYFNRTEIFYHWTVLEELTDRSGYKIFYNEEEDIFGLGVLTKEKKLLAVGLYGSFLSTLESM
jgi:hypothetical protein